MGALGILLGENAGRLGKEFTVGSLYWETAGATSFHDRENKTDIEY